MEPISMESKRIKLIICKPAAIQQRSNSKHKVEEKLDYELLSLEIDLSKAITTRNHRSKRCQE
jgi:hypothetical protein